MFLTRGIETIGWLFCFLLIFFVGFNALESLTVASMGDEIPLSRLETMWLLNPRGVSIMAVILAGTLISLIYSWFPDRQNLSEGRQSPIPSAELTRHFGTVSYVMGLGLVILETIAWGAKHVWLPSTILSACAIWTAMFLVGATLWRVTRRVAWVDAIVQGLLVTLSTLLTLSTLSLIGTIPSDLSTFPEQNILRWLLNPAAIGYFVSVLVCAIAARLYSKYPSGRGPEVDRGHETDQRPNRLALKKSTEWTLPQYLGVAAYLIGLVAFVVETCAWGYPHGWLTGTLLAASVAWLSMFVIGLAAWGARFRTADFDRLLGVLFLGLLTMVLLMTSGTLGNLTDHTFANYRAFRTTVEPWIWNSHFMTFLAAIIAASVSGWLYRGLNRSLTLQESRPGKVKKTIDVSSLLATAVYIAGVTMFSLEVYTQGKTRDWQTATSLAITLVWTTYATLTLIVGIYARSGWVRVFSLGLFVLTVAKVFMFDVWHLETVIRVIAFISLGAALLLVSFLYRRFRDRIRSWMAPEL
jgi:hypothetical protein